LEVVTMAVEGTLPTPPGAESAMTDPVLAYAGRPPFTSVAPTVVSALAAGAANVDTAPHRAINVVRKTFMKELVQTGNGSVDHRWSTKFPSAFLRARRIEGRRRGEALPRPGAGKPRQRQWQQSVGANRHHEGPMTGVGTLDRCHAGARTPFAGRQRQQEFPQCSHGHWPAGPNG
jgi:hypothetical protein